MAACIESCRKSASRFSDNSHNAGKNSNPACKWSMFCRPSSADRIPPVAFPRERESNTPSATSAMESSDLDGFQREEEKDDRDDCLWVKIQDEARADVASEPMLSGYYQDSILSRDSLEKALGNHLSLKLSNSSLPSCSLYEIFIGVLLDDPEIMKAVRYDLRAVRTRDPACISYVHCLLHFKGFLACQAHRVAHRLWSQGRQVIALIIQNRVSEVFAVDIHPGARIGCGVLLDHATGIVVGETAVVGDNVSVLHNVTLGGTGKVSGERHPKIGNGVLIGAGTCILGNIKIGDGAKIGAGSVVLKDVPPRTTAVGNPAKLVGGNTNPIKLEKMPSFTMDHLTFIRVVRLCNIGEALFRFYASLFKRELKFSYTNAFSMDNSCCSEPCTTAALLAELSGAET